MIAHSFFTSRLFTLLLCGTLAFSVQPLYAKLSFELSPLMHTNVESPLSTNYWVTATQEPNSPRLWSQTQLLLGVSGVALGVLYCLPENITKWDRDKKIRELPDDWWQNVKRRPVWDKDNWFINYVGHPYCGAAYYQMARKSGYGQLSSFAYSAAVSTLYWEYGLEAFAERPSIQDLIVTPVGGWVLGELAHRWEEHIEDNHGQVLGSTLIGDVTRFFLDPMDHLGRGLNKLVGKEWILTGNAGFDTPYQSQTFTPNDPNTRSFLPKFYATLTRDF